MAKGSLLRALKSLRYVRGVANWRDIAVAAWRGDDVLALELRNGVTIRAAPGHGMVGMYKEIWYRDAYGLRSDPLRPGATVIDIGANIGIFSLYAAVVGRAARVLSYEPFPESFRLLCGNAEQNRLDAIRAFRLAVAGDRGQRQLYVGLGHGLNTLLGTPGRTAVSVDCVTLEDVFEREHIDRCDLLKLDCEGAEYEILLNAPRSLLHRIDRVAMEYHSVAAHTPDELVALLETAGFQVRRSRTPVTGYLFARR